MMPLSRAWGEYLARDVGRPIFGLVGSGNFTLVESFVRAGGRFIPAMHEGAAVGMAAGWAALTQQAVVASIHQGPGFTNTLTSLSDAAKGRLPVVLLAAEAADPNHHQWIAQADILRASGLDVGVASLEQPDLDVLVDVLHAAQREQRMWVLGVPIAINESECQAASAAGAAPLANAAGHGERIACLSELIAQAADHVNRAERPIILAGRGAVRAQATQTLGSIADLLGAPLVTSAAAVGSFGAHDRVLGLVGGLAHDDVVTAMQQADVVLVVGASLDTWSTIGGRLLAHQPAVIRIDSATVNEWPNQITIPCDAQQGVEQLHTALDPDRSRPSKLTWFTRAGGAQHVQYAADDPRAIIEKLDRMLPDARSVSLDSGHFMAVVVRHMHRFAGPHFNFGQDFQSVGLGLFHAIGAALARPDLLPIAIIGDGGAGMSFLELQTAVDQKLPLLVVIMNDGGYGAEVHDFEPLGHDVSIVTFPRRDWSSIARGMGAQAHTIRAANELDVIVDWLQSPDGPYVLDCHIDPTFDVATTLTAAGAAEWSGEHLETGNTPH